MPSSEEDDYLTMAIPEPSATTSRKHETLTEKKKRLAREAEARAHPKSKAELALDAKRKRAEGLQRNLLASNGDGQGEGDTVQSKGAAMMAKLGYKPGTALGKATDPSATSSPDTRLLVPIGISEREGRAGIGADAERKRKIRAEFEAREEGEKRQKVDAEEYRIRQAREKEEKRQEAMLWGAMKVAEKLDEEEEQNGEAIGADVAGEPVKVKKSKNRRLGSISVLWRRLVKQRQISERDKRMRHDLQSSLSQRADYEEDPDDRIALGKEAEEVDTELDMEDEELAAFEDLPVAERLEKLVSYLRERWRYCFWCKHRYEDEGMEGCPGVREEDHD